MQNEVRVYGPASPVVFSSCDVPLFAYSPQRVLCVAEEPVEPPCSGKPDAIRVDDGPEYISATLLNWAAKRYITIVHIPPGKPQQNAKIERYDRTVRQEWLGRYIFETIQEVQDHATPWLWTYNNGRPNMGAGGITPIQKLKMAA
jgi:transposase InsO family protein